MGTTKTVSRPRRLHVVALISTCTVAMLIVVGFVYVALLQSYRQNANDPQIELAGTWANQISAGAKDASAIFTSGSTTVDPSSGLGVFGVVVDADGKVISSNMKMDGTTPLPPKSVLTVAGADHQNRVTWQPQSGTRIALVVQGYNHAGVAGYVLAGRSLKEVDARTAALAWMSGAAAMVVLLLGIFASAVYVRKSIN
jgi:hypothetical protein